MKKKNGKKHKHKRTVFKGVDNDGVNNEVEVMGFETKWGKKTDLYYVDADSASGSDEEHLVREAFEDEKEKYSKIDEFAFNAFDDAIGQIAEEIEENQEEEIKGADEFTEEEKEEVNNNIIYCVKQINEANKKLNEDNVPENQKLLLSSIITNCSYYLYLISMGEFYVDHSSLDAVEKATSLISGEAVEFEEEIDYDEEEEEVPQKHIPYHLREVKDGENRPITYTMHKNKVFIKYWGKKKTKGGSRQKIRHKYSQRIHDHNLKHKERNINKYGAYSGERSGIDMNKVSSVDYRDKK